MDNKPGPELTDSQIDQYIEDLERFLGAITHCIVVAAMVEHNTPGGCAPEAMLNVLAVIAEDVDKRLIAMHSLRYGDHEATHQANWPDT